jgi:hypothetical protein
MYNDGALAGADDADLVEVAGAVGAHEHRHALVEVLDENRVVEGVEDGLIADTVLLALSTIRSWVTSYLVSTT